MRSTIPLDIFGEIISHLRHNGYALRKCALLCKSVLPLCQKILFATIDLSDVSSEKTYNRLAQVFTERPHLSSYVKSLTIYIRPKWAFSNSRLPIPDQCDALCRIFQTFTQLEKLTIIVRIRRWKNAGDTVETLVHHLLASPNLSSVEFKGEPGYYLPISYLDRLNHIPDITLTRLSLEHPVKSSGSTRGTKTTSLSLKALQEPDLQELAKIAYDPNISLDLSSLASLHIIDEGLEDDYLEEPVKHYGISEILKMSSRSLTQFSWSSEHLSSLPMLENIDGSSLLAVRSITFKFKAQYDFLLDAQLKAAIKFLSTLPTSGSYEIAFDCIWRRWEDNIGGWSSREWKALGSLLAQRTAIVKLRVFLGYPRFGGGTISDLEIYVDNGVFAFGQNLVSLCEKKVLSVEAFWSWSSNRDFVTVLQESKNSSSFTRRL